MAGLVLDLGQQDRLAAKQGARVIQLPSGCMPMISECACCAICLTMFDRYLAGIQSRGSILRSRETVSSKWASRSSPRWLVVMRSALLVACLFIYRSFGNLLYGGELDQTGMGATVTEQLAWSPLIGRRTPRRRGRPGYDLEAALRVAVEVFNERGYDGASMEDLSRRLGIAKSGIYHHVSGKEELLRLALDRALDGLWEAGELARGTGRARHRAAGDAGAGRGAGAGGAAALRHPAVAGAR